MTFGNFTKPLGKKSFLTPVKANQVSPALEVKFSSITQPYVYKGEKGKYNITLLIDPEQEDQMKFLEMITELEKEHNCPQTIIKTDSEKGDGEYISTGKYVIKMSNKNKPYVFVMKDGVRTAMEADAELPRGTKVRLEYDANAYVLMNNPGFNGLTLLLKAVEIVKESADAPVTYQKERKTPTEVLDDLFGD